MSMVTKPPVLNETGIAIAAALEAMAGRRTQSRVVSLTPVELASGTVIDVVGCPAYITDVSGYADYGITEPGWYVFARIASRDGLIVTGDTTVEGAAGAILPYGEAHVDVAVRFEVAAQSQRIIVHWGEYSEVFVFRATDLAVRNLDYRTTFYVYDIGPYAVWTFARTTDATFLASKGYYTKDGEEYVKAEVVTGEAVVYYYEDHYALTADETFAEGKTYYTEADGVYTASEVTVGEAVTPDTYYEHSYVVTEDETYAEGKVYWTKDGDAYTPAEVTAGEAVLVYYVHSKLHFEGMTRNVSYKFDELVDAPIEVALPEIEDDGHGAWVEIQMRYSSTWSCTLIPPTEDVKVGTVTTQAQSAGINVLDLHYNAVSGAKLWSLINTHSNIPA